MDRPLHARLLNAGGELIAEGSCWVDEAANVATLEPEREPGVLRKERGVLALELETGRTLRVSQQPIVFRLGPASGSGESGRRTVYRMRLIDHAQEATAAGAAGEGAPAPPERETPAAR